MRPRDQRFPLTALLAALTVTFLVACDLDEAGPTPTLTPATATPADADTDPDPAETLDLVAERIEALIDLERGADLEISLLDDEALAELIAELLADPESIESIRRDQDFYALFGLIRPHTDLLELNEEMLNAGVAGLYRPELDHLYIRLFGSFSSLEEATASHEYAHYLQDVHFDLDRMFDDDAGDRDAELALQALIEGDATYIQFQYVAEHFNAVQTFGMSFGGLMAASEAPSVAYVFGRETSFVYLGGQRWIDDMLWFGFERGDLYANPPRTTREILDQTTYTDGLRFDRVELALDFGALPGDWTVGPRETIGQLLLSIWLEEVGVRPSRADDAASGWTGDALHVLHQDGEAVAFVAQVDWEAPAEAIEFTEAASGALDDDRRYERQVCSGCAPGTWQGPAGILTIHALDTGSTLLVVAPSTDEVQQLIDAVR